MLKKFSNLVEERKLQYETTINMDTSILADYLATMSVEKRNEFLHELEIEKKAASEKIDNPSQIVENIKRKIILNSIKFIESL